MVKSERTINEVKNVRTGQFPTDPQDRFNAVFSAIGNSEAKCLTLLSLKPYPLTTNDLNRLFIQYNKGVWKPDDRLQANYCNATLEPIGMVAEADVLYDGSNEYVVGYSATQEGIHYGHPIASYLLEQSSKSPYSLLEIFGATSKGAGDTRPILNKIRILKFLCGQSLPLRTTDISAELGMEKAMVGKRLRDLSRVGVVEYASAGIDNPGYAKYKLTESADRGQVVTSRTDVRLTQLIADLFFRLEIVDCNNLVKKLQENYPDSLSRVPIGALRSRVSMVLNDFARLGICQPVMFRGGSVMSRCTITELGTRVVNNVIIPIERLLADDEELLGSWSTISWQKYVPETVAKYRQASGNANRESRDQQALEIIAIIQSNPGIRPKELKLGFKRQTSSILRMLLKDGRVKKTRENYAVRYYPA